MASPASNPDSSDQAIAAALAQYWGFDSLRPLQREAIDAALAGRDSLVVLPTGGGKSLCYQIPPLVSESLDVIVSPLIALMKDQVDGLREASYPAAALHSGMTQSERQASHQKLEDGLLRALFVAPERLLTSDFLAMLQKVGVGRFAIDEAHCISQWGHDFRREYRQLSTLRQHFPQASFHAFTATATPRVRRDIVEQLRLCEPVELVGVFDRPNLIYRVLPKMDVQEQTLQAIERHKSEAAIVYCISRRDTESMATFLRSRGVSAAHYHAGMSPAERRKTQDDFSNEKLDVVAATVAFGMGIDRSNVRLIVHASLPKSLEHYQQETGRAGRDGMEAECVLFYSGGDAMTWESILRNSSLEADRPAEQLNAQMELLRNMRVFCTGGDCRHKAISEYFGQPYQSPNCAACDVCMAEVEFVPEATIIAQKILSCVYRVGQRFGVGHVADVLMGANTELVRTMRHEQLSTFGLLREMPKKQLQALVHQLIDAGALERTAGDKPTLRLNAMSWQILKGERQARLVRPIAKVAARSKRGTADRTGMDETLFERLRLWRRNLAQERGVPPYVIFGDATLAELAKRRPANVDQLRGTPGIGAKREEQFGEMLLDEIRRHLCDNGAPAIEIETVGLVVGRKVNSAKEAAFAAFRLGASIDDAMDDIGRARSTTVAYLEEFLQLEPQWSIDQYVAPGLQTAIRTLVMELGCPPMKPILARLDGKATWDDIRLVVALMRVRGEVVRSGLQSAAIADDIDATTA